MHSAIKMLDEIEITSEMLFADAGLETRRLLFTWQFLYSF